MSEIPDPFESTKRKKIDWVGKAIVAVWILLILFIAVGLPVWFATHRVTGPDGDTLFKRHCLAHHGTYYHSEDAGQSLCRYNGGKP